MRIRQLTPLDAKRFQALRLIALQTEPANFGASFHQEKNYPLEKFEQRLAVFPDRGLFGAFDGDDNQPDDPPLIGMVALNRDDSEKFAHKGSITSMYVAPAARGKGIGRALLVQAIDMARGVGALHQLLLTVNASNTGAIGLYASLGFKTFGREPSGIRVDGRFYDELLMYLMLRDGSTDAQ
jgi:ribosomal protein S18 acetylase RimI-like enzyme